MKEIVNTRSKSVLNKLFVKLCRLLGYELIDQNNLYLPVSNKSANDQLSLINTKSINLPLGVTYISRKVKSLDIIIKTCTSVNLVTQNKKRIFEKEKSEYTFRTINSLKKNIELLNEFSIKIPIKIYIIDHNSKKEDLIKIKDILKNLKTHTEIINLNTDNFNQIKTINKNNKIIENNMKSTMASIFKSFEIANKYSEDLVYFVEDDYIHKKEALCEMILTYEKISSQINKELFICPIDYPYLYNKTEESKILIGNKYHWRTTGESLLTFMTSKKMLQKYLEKFNLMSTIEHNPFETPLHKIYKEELCLSPMPSLAMHCTNVNSIFGLSPNLDWKKIWEENEIK